jgi:hypothetical protein
MHIIRINQVCIASGSDTSLCGGHKQCNCMWWETSDRQHCTRALYGQMTGGQNMTQKCENPTCGNLNVCISAWKLSFVVHFRGCFIFAQIWRFKVGCRKVPCSILDWSPVLRFLFFVIFLVYSDKCMGTMLKEAKIISFHIHTVRLFLAFFYRCSWNPCFCGIVA